MLNELSSFVVSCAKFMLQKSRDDYIKICRHHHTAFDMRLWEDIGNKTGLFKCHYFISSLHTIYSIVCWAHHNTPQRGWASRHASQRSNPGVPTCPSTMCNGSFFLSFFLSV